LTEPQFLAVVRHGESEANAELITTACGLYYSLCGSDPAVPLTMNGRRQIWHGAGKQLARTFPRERKVARVYHTAFERVVQSAVLIRQRLPYKVELIRDDRINKRSYGRFWNLSRQGVRTLYPDEWQRYRAEGDLQYRAPDGGENYFDMFARVDSFLDEVINPSTSNTLVVTHSAPMLAFQRRLEGLDVAEVVRQYEAVTIANAQVLLYQRDAVGQNWQRCELLSRF
jgi:broad specificity phosphatase PhoE